MTARQAVAEPVDLAPIGTLSAFALAPVTPAEALRRRRIGRTNRLKAMVRRPDMLGNSYTLRHGIYSQVAVRPEVEDECALLYARAPWLSPVRDGVLVEATARLIVRLRKFDPAIDAAAAKGLVPMTSLYSRCEGQLTRNLAELGLTPSSAAALGLAHMDAREKAQRMSDRALDAYRVTPGEKP
jgi:hypothetical protein